MRLVYIPEFFWAPGKASERKEDGEDGTPATPVPKTITNLTEDELEQIRKATHAGMLSVEFRNRLYAGLGRAMKRDDVPAPVLARYAKDRNNFITQFVFLKEWIDGNGQWGKMTITEEHIR